MIFITTGTVSFPFKRLVDYAINTFGGKSEEVIIQAGYYNASSGYQNLTIKDFFSYQKTLRFYKGADLILSACGEGSVFLILKHSKNVPIFFPRLKKYGEHVDDQQFQTAKFLKNNSLARVAFDTLELNSLISKKNQTNKVKLQKAEPAKLIKVLDQITLAAD